LVFVPLTHLSVSKSETITTSTLTEVVKP